MFRPEINAQAASVFGAWFNVDLIDLSDPSELESLAGTCAVDLSRQIPDMDALTHDLSEMQRQWTPQVVGWFMDATHVDWLFDEDTEASLKTIVAEVIQELRRIQASRASGR